MRTLTRLIKALPLILAINSCKFFIPPTPESITPNTNHAPIANLALNPESGYAPLTTNISLTGTDQDNDSIGYQVKIDINADGTIDERLPDNGSFSPNPINVDKVFPNIGKSIIYGTVQDARGLQSEKNNEVIVSEKSVIENKLPTANLSASPSSGQYPLTTNISLSGTDSDGTVVGYKLKIDSNGDGKIEKTIPTDGSFSANPISDSETFNSSGDVRIYGIVKDDKDGETQTSKSVNVLERNDLTAKVTFVPLYKVGDKLSFSAQVQNNTANDIIIDNTNKESLEYKLIKVGTTEPVIDKKFNQTAKVKLLSPNGYIKLDYLNNKFKINNADIVSSPWGVYLWSVWGAFTDENGEYSIEIPSADYSFTEPGQYFIETEIKYSMNRNNYQVKLDSDKFQVNQ